MKLFGGRATIKQLQWLVWVAVLFILFFTYLPEDGIYQAGAFAIINLAFYIILIYGNISFLFPRFYEKGRTVSYALYVVIFLIGTGIIRGYVIMYLDIHFFSPKPMPMTFSMFVYFIVAGFLTFLLSFIFRIAIAYFALKQQSEKILVQKSQAELNLLKSQVQPHFLFNTLNNIYYKVYKVDAISASLIERLSDIMRYFVDESPKDIVPLSTEVAFIENYMALEKIRIRYGVTIDFEKAYNAELRIPPMLLMTFVENIFKHGIDKSIQQNQINVSLIQKDGYLVFKTSNRKFNPVIKNEANGFGIANLDKRLKILYGSDFELTTKTEGELYLAFLKIPLT